ncbi:MAG: hypothetical protein GY768_05200 [Planctomycetaceae bacterium]|nr:hypothetical protein [Planctomycetaceae bacterium]
MEKHSPPKEMKTFSFIICSRNDQHGGNSLWRLETTLNFLAFSANKTVGLDSVEILVCDWGSRHPIRKSVALTAEAVKITRFIEVPPPIANEAEGDSTFAEVFANNVAIRRATGQFIGRIDQDTLVGEEFFLNFYRFTAETTEPSIQTAVMFVGRRSIPFSFASRSPNFEKVRGLIEMYGRWLPREGITQAPWFDAPVGIILMHRNLWHVCRGYDQSLKYWGFMETDLILRLLPYYHVLKLENQIGCHFYHLSHSKKSLGVTSRRKNKRIYPTEIAPNSCDWGMQYIDFELHSANVLAAQKARDPPRRKSICFSVAAEWSWHFFRSLLCWIRRLLMGPRIELGRTK